MDFKFCPQCGNKLILNQAGDDGLVPFCTDCEKFFFNVFPTCVIAMVVNEYNEVALLKQSYLSDKYMTFPAGYMHEGENSEHAIIREIKEEIGLEIHELKYVDSVWFHAKNMLMLGFIAKTYKSEFKLSKEVDEAKWIKIEDVSRYLFPEHPDNIARHIYQQYVQSSLQEC